MPVLWKCQCLGPLSPTKGLAQNLWLYVLFVCVSICIVCSARKPLIDEVNISKANCDEIIGPNNLLRLFYKCACLGKYTLY